MYQTHIAEGMSMTAAHRKIGDEYGVSVMTVRYHLDPEERKRVRERAGKERSSEEARRTATEIERAGRGLERIVRKVFQDGKPRSLARIFDELYAVHRDPRYAPLLQQVLEDLGLEKTARGYRRSRP